MQLVTYRALRPVIIGGKTVAADEEFKLTPSEAAEMLNCGQIVVAPPPAEPEVLENSPDPDAAEK